MSLTIANLKINEIQELKFEICPVISKFQVYITSNKL